MTIQTISHDRILEKTRGNGRGEVFLQGEDCL